MKDIPNLNKSVVVSDASLCCSADIYKITKVSETGC